MDLTDIHVSSYAWPSQLWKKSKVQKKAQLTRRVWLPVSTYILACVEIQRMVRGVLLRRRMVAKFVNHNFTRAKSVLDERAVAAYLYVPKQELLPTCIARIISRVRTSLRRAAFLWNASLKTFSIYSSAASTIARSWRIYSLRKRKRILAVSVRKYEPTFTSAADLAAWRIQRAWKGHIGKHIFQFYQQLIQNRERCDARLLLKSINPCEAALIDSAANVHIRFRLGGNAFPPTIFYKVYIHGPICDLGALAPRDYTKLMTLPSQMLHSQKYDVSVLKATDTTGWYRRIDNNEWRPVNGRDFFSVETLDRNVQAKGTDPLLQSQPIFHPSSRVRQEQKEKHRKERRRKWLMKLYTQNQDNLDIQVKPLSPAEQLLEDDALLEQEVKTLVDWSDHLDFNTYQDHWLATATALCIENWGSSGSSQPL